TYVALISQDFWIGHFGGSTDILGKQVRLNENVFTIIGVMPASCRFPASVIEVWIPFDPMKLNPVSGRTVVNPVAKVRRGLALKDADAQVSALAPELDQSLRNSPGGATSRLQSLDRYDPNGLIGDAKPVRDRRRGIFVVFGAGLLVLLVSCVNSANLF